MKGPLRGKLNQTAVYWAPSSSFDMYGNPILEEPDEISCRWDETQDEYVDASGTVHKASIKVFVDQDLEVGGVLMQGTLDDVLEGVAPKEHPGAYEIRQFSTVPNLKARYSVRSALV